VCNILLLQITVALIKFTKPFGWQIQCLVWARECKKKKKTNRNQNLHLFYTHTHFWSLFRPLNCSENWSVGRLRLTATVATPLFIGVTRPTLWICLFCLSRDFLYDQKQSWTNRHISCRNVCGVVATWNWSSRVLAQNWVILSHANCEI
jgi:hypothetical protein